MFLLRWISFRGRVSLGRYWLAYVLPLVVLPVLAGVADWAIFGLPGGLRFGPAVPTVAAQGFHFQGSWRPTGPISQAWFWISWLPGLAGMTRRWHDRGRSGWFCLLLLVPIVGWLWTLVSLYFRDGVRGANRFGPDPLEARA